MGCKIFNRTPQGTVLTEDGKKILVQAELILSNVENLLHITANESTQKYTLTLAAIPAACNELTISLLSTLAADYPEITLNILEMRPQKVLSCITNGLADIALGSYTPANQKQIMLEVQKNNLHLEPLLNDSLYVFLPRNHPKAKKRCITLKDLAAEKQAIFNDFTLVEGDDTFCTEEKNSFECYTFSDRSCIKQAVAAGLAYAILPHQMALGDIYVHSGKIKAIPIADSNVPITTYLAWRKSNYMPRQEELILDLIRTLYLDTQERLANLATFIPIENDDNTILRY